MKLEFTETDYLNLTNYGLFVRMVRPQVQQVTFRRVPREPLGQDANVCVFNATSNSVVVSWSRGISDVSGSPANRV